MRMNLASSLVDSRRVWLRRIVCWAGALLCLGVLLPAEVCGAFPLVGSAAFRAFGLAVYGLAFWVFLHALAIRLSAPRLFLLLAGWLCLVQAARPMTPPLIGRVLIKPFTLGFGGGDLLAAAAVLLLVARSLVGGRGCVLNTGPTSTDDSLARLTGPGSSIATARSEQRNINSSPLTETEGDVISVLGQLGYSRRHAERAVKSASTCNEISFESLLKHSLGALAK